MREIYVDNFAGGGGASTGMALALGRSVDVAINHDPIALACHEANHPESDHYIESVWDVDPRTVYPDHQVGHAWFSPDCRHFSKAKGGAPVSARVRGLAWVALRWVALRKPRVVYLENVEEFQTWGPLVKAPDGSLFPCPKRKGNTFRSFVNALKRHGYVVEWRELRACDYGAPTSRKRLILIARSDGQPIRWPRPTHGPGLIPYKTAAECIDWSLPCPSIFNRKRPLAEATLRRIANGIMRYVINAEQPFIVPGEVVPFITEHANTSHQRNFPADEPLLTQCAQVKGGHFALVTAFLAKHYGGVVGHEVDKVLGTVTTVDHHSLVTASIVKLRGTSADGQAIDQPLHTVSAGGTHHGLVISLLEKVDGSSRSDFDVCGEGFSDDQRQRGDLETCLSNQLSENQTHNPTSSRNQAGSGLLGSSGALGESRVLGNSSSSGLDASSWPDSRRIGHQPQGWQQGQQSPEQLGIDDSFRESEACLSTGFENASEPPDCGKSSSGSFGTSGSGAVLFTDSQGLEGFANDSLPSGADRVTAFLIKFYSEGGQWQGLNEPMHTIPTKDRLAIVYVRGEAYQIVDIGLRMLQPHELAMAQGFPPGYQFVGKNGKPLTKKDQVRLIGNSVCPPLAEAIVRENSTPPIIEWSNVA